MDIESKKKLFGEALAADRASNGLSQQALADDLDVAQQSLSKWEAGICYPRDYRILQIGKYFGPASHTAKFAQEIKKQRCIKIVARTNGIPLHEVSMDAIERSNYGLYESVSKNEAQSFSFETKNFPLRIFNSLKILSELQSAMETTINDIRQELKSLAKSSNSERE